jgi:hypothetical protein
MENLQQLINNYGYILIMIFLVMIICFGFLLIGFGLGRIGQSRSPNYQQTPVFRSNKKNNPADTEPGEFDDPWSECQQVGPSENPNDDRESIME